jgi:hypothetical protein
MGRETERASEPVSDDLQERVWVDRDLRMSKVQSQTNEARKHKEGHLKHDESVR